MENQIKQLTEQYDWKWRLQSVSSQLLFHYTGINALKNIFETKELWASKSDFLNDYSEIQYIKDVFDKVYNFVKTNYNEEIAGFFELVNSGLEEYFNKKLIGEEYSQIFVISLSENNDSLVLWSNYSNIDGYNLHFYSNQIFDVISRQRELGLFDACYPTKFIYNEQEQLTILFEEIMRIYHLMREQKLIDIDTINQATAICQITIETYAMFFKKPVFHQEDEYRIAFIIHDKEKLKNIRYRASNGSLVPYIALSINDPICPISGITIGPKNNTDTSLIGLRHFLCHKGYEHIKNNILRSGIPLRF